MAITAGPSITIATADVLKEKICPWASLEEIETNLEEEEKEKKVMQFMRKMLQWNLNVAHRLSEGASR
jgi:hypothetical protein